MRDKPKELILMSAFLQAAISVADASTCRRAAVGCVITTTDFSQVLSYGYNGTAKGYPNDGCSGTDEPGSCRGTCVHAETNAVIKAPRGEKVAFVSCAPCRQCALALVNADIVAVVYRHGHREITEGLELFEDLGIPHGDVDEVFDQMYGEQGPDLETYDGWMEVKAMRSKFGGSGA